MSVDEDGMIGSTLQSDDARIVECVTAINSSECSLEPAEMPHAETLEIMRQMDTLRAAWQIRYPFE